MADQVSYFGYNEPTADILIQNPPLILARGFLDLRRKVRRKWYTNEEAYDEDYGLVMTETVTTVIALFTVQRFARELTDFQQAMVYLALFGSLALGVVKT